MEARWWSCVLGLLCMPAEVLLHTWTVSQNPRSISIKRVNSSVDITCSTSLSNPMGLYLKRRFQGEDIVFLSLDKGQVTKDTTNPKFTGRIQVTPEEVGMGQGFTLQLSLLGLDDTDLYYCTWTHFKLQTSTREAQSSNGTIIIVREMDLQQKQCESHIIDLVLIFLCVTAFTFMLLLFIGALIMRCRRFKKRFRPARVVRPSRRDSPQYVCPQHRIQHRPYMITSLQTTDFRGIL
ncbi:uncharacterized protein LOC108872585 [Lates japonicus]